MRKKRYLGVLWGVLLLSGCSAVRRLPPETAPPLPPQTTCEDVAQFPVTRSGRILEKLWHFYDGERFLGYGGEDQSLREGPGELDLTNRQGVLEKFYLPPDCWDSVAEGASFTHLLNPHAFTCAVFGLEQAHLPRVAKAWRENLHRQRWQGGKPEQLLIMELDSRHILLVLGKPQMVRCMENAAKKVFSGSLVLYREGLVG